jgi:methyl-accepting chemotaxis protein
VNELKLQLQAAKEANAAANASAAQIYETRFERLETSIAELTGSVKAATLAMTSVGTSATQAAEAALKGVTTAEKVLEIVEKQGDGMSSLDGEKLFQQVSAF